MLRRHREAVEHSAVDGAGAMESFTAAPPAQVQLPLIAPSSAMHQCTCSTHWLQALGQGICRMRRTLHVII